MEIFGFEVNHEYIIQYVEAFEHNSWTFEVHFDTFSVFQTVWGILYFSVNLTTYSIIRVTLNTESDTLQRFFFHAHAIEWIIVNVVLLESLFTKVRCIHLLRSLSWIFLQQT